MPSDNKTKSDQMREDLQKIIDMIPENKEDNISIRNMLRDTLTGAADMLFYFRRAIETGESPTPEQMMQTTMDFAPVPAGVAAKMTPKNAVGILGSRFYSKDKTLQNRLNKELSFRADEARQMQAAGKTPEEIWDKLKLDQDRDGNWVFEIPDTDAKIDWQRLSGIENSNKVKLSEVLDHPELFKYTDLADIEVRPTMALEPDNAAYRTLGNSRTIELSYEEIQRAKKLREIADESAKNGHPLAAERRAKADLYERNLKKTLFHEIQHGQQHVDEDRFLIPKGRGTNIQAASRVTEQILKPLDKMGGANPKISGPLPTDLQPFVPLLKFVKSEMQRAGQEYIKSIQSNKQAYQDLATSKGTTLQGLVDKERYRKRDWTVYASETGEIEARIAGERAVSPWLKDVPPSKTPDPNTPLNDRGEHSPWPVDWTYKKKNP